MEDFLDRSRHFEELVHEHHVRVRAFVRSLGADPDWVDDLSQEAFIKAYNDWDSFDQSRDFGKWVRGIAANLVRNEIRKQSRRQRLLQSNLSELLLNHRSEPEESNNPLTLDAIRDCLSKLSNAHRDLIRGRYHDGLTAPELADRLEKSAANVRQILVRIRRQIRLCVDQQLSSTKLT